MNGGTKKTGRGGHDRAQLDAAAAAKIDRELERHLEVLGGLIESRGHSAAGLEARLGWERGHVRQLLSRRQPLEYGELLALLEALGVEPKEYFALVTSLETEH